MLFRFRLIKNYAHAATPDRNTFRRMIFSAATQRGSARWHVAYSAQPGRFALGLGGAAITGRSCARFRGHNSLMAADKCKRGLYGAYVQARLQECPFAARPLTSYGIE